MDGRCAAIGFIFGELGLPALSIVLVGVLTDLWIYNWHIHSALIWTKMCCDRVSLGSAQFACFVH